MVDAECTTMYQVACFLFMSTRFSILHHQEPAGEHWDLMLERGDVLLTWQLDVEPVSRDVLPIVARRIADHRKRYLTYEGPISDDRGTVRRVDSGSVEFENITESKLVVRLAGNRLVGTFLLSKGQNDWEFRAQE